MDTCIKQGNKMNVNGFCVKQGQGLKNYHANFPLIAPLASSPGTDIFAKRTPSTAPNGVFNRGRVPKRFFGIRDVPYEAWDPETRTSPQDRHFSKKNARSIAPNSVLLEVSQ